MVGRHTVGSVTRMVLVLAAALTLLVAVAPHAPTAGAAGAVAVTSVTAVKIPANTQFHQPNLTGVTFTVKNVGSSASGAFTITVSGGGTTKTIANPGLAAGASKTYNSLSFPGFTCVTVTVGSSSVSDCS